MLTDRLYSLLGMLDKVIHVASLKFKQDAIKREKYNAALQEQNKKDFKLEALIFDSMARLKAPFQTKLKHKPLLT